MNIYQNEENRQKYLNRYFMPEGIQALEKRLETLVKFYLKKDTVYPIKQRLLGFIPLQIQNKEQLEGHMKELAQIIGLQQIKVEVGNNDG